MRNNCPLLRWVKTKPKDLTNIFWQEGDPPALPDLTSVKKVLLLGPFILCSSSFMLTHQSRSCCDWVRSILSVLLLRNEFQRLNIKNLFRCLAIITQHSLYLKIERHSLFRVNIKYVLLARWILCLCAEWRKSLDRVNFHINLFPRINQSAQKINPSVKRALIYQSFFQSFLSFATMTEHSDVQHLS